MLDAIPYIMSGITPEMLAKIGFSRKDMLKWCRYDSRNCKDEEFTEIADPDSGKCFSFNWDARNHADRSGEASGKKMQEM